MISLTRRYHFSASHRLHVEALSDPENRTLFGKCNNPFGHGHNYVLSVTVSGKVDPSTGLLLRLATLDQLVEEIVMRRLAHRNLNADVTEFAELVPTTENLALVVAGWLADVWPSWFEKSEAHLAAIHVQETERNGFEVRLNERRPKLSILLREEAVTANG